MRTTLQKDEQKPTCEGPHDDVEMARMRRVAPAHLPSCQDRVLMSSPVPGISRATCFERTPASTSTPLARPDMPVSSLTASMAGTRRT